MTGWTLEKSLVVVREIALPAFDAGYNVTLGGGVLLHGESTRDLDLYFHRRPQVLRVSRKCVRRYFTNAGWNTVPGKSGFLKNRMQWVEKMEAPSGLVIDLNFHDLPGQTEPVLYPTPEESRAWQARHREKLVRLHETYVGNI